MNPEQVRERESRWALPAALAAFAAVVLMILPSFVSAISGSGEAEALRSIDAHNGSVTLTSLLQAISFALLAIPLAYLFRAARARSERVLPQLLTLVVVAPLLVGVGTVLYGQARQEAADSFVAGEAKPSLSSQEAKEKCDSDREEDESLAACEKREREDDAASNALSDASLTTVAAILTLGGGLLFAISLFYTCLWAMRTGLLSRFWGSLGMALGIAVLIGFVILAVVWFLYLGLLFLGLVPGGKPPAWETGEATPWPTPGERAAAELEPREPHEQP
jgi:small-conductance mechanosensitive channel